MLAVEPKYRKLGLGLALMKWGCDEADVEKVPIYLDGTEAGSRVFKKLGFVSQGMSMGLNSMVREPEELGVSSAKL
jgi:predicted N-acetyltransferase YhbS